MLLFQSYQPAAKGEFGFDSGLNDFLASEATSYPKTCAVSGGAAGASAGFGPAFGSNSNSDMFLQNNYFELFRLLTFSF
jgi:hypothetical protein